MEYKNSVSCLTRPVREVTCYQCYWLRGPVDMVSCVKRHLMNQKGFRMIFDPFRDSDIRLMKKARTCRDFRSSE